MQFQLTTTSRKLFFKEIAFQMQGFLRIKLSLIFHRCGWNLTNLLQKSNYPPAQSIINP